MKNITVSVDDHLYYRARIRAAEMRSTVSALVRHFLTQIVEEGPAFDRLQREQNDVIARIRSASPGFSAADRLSRTEVHERDAVR
jgi:antitoxin component of RelBE/YafQ-DinJ toxin-antitoxin module